MEIEPIIRGDILSAARLMRDIEDGIPSARDVLKALYPYTGNAHIIGVTGAPGSGKSTLVDQLIKVARKQDQTVGVVAVDPTSPFTKGAILGDRIRMQGHSTDDGVFIRSVATRGHLGGLSRSAHEVVDIMDAMGKDLIIVETVGVGQDEVEIIRLAHTIIVVQVPKMGDGIQAIKAGILEIGDIFVVNKADLDGADKAVQELEMMLAIKSQKISAWQPPVVKTVAAKAAGIEKLMKEIVRHIAHFRKSTGQKAKRKRIKERFLEILRDLLYQTVVQRLDDDNIWPDLLETLEKRKSDPYSSAEIYVKKYIKCIHEKED